MAKASDVPRQTMPEQDPIERGKNFNEVALGYAEETAVLEASRCLQCKKPKCVEGCPVDIDIPAFITALNERRFDDAIRILKEKNNLPAICGRVCPQETQCEIECIRGNKGLPVAIGYLERYVGDWARGQNDQQTLQVAPSRHPERQPPPPQAYVHSAP